MAVVYPDDSGNVIIGGEPIPISSLGIDWGYINANYYNAEYVCVAQPRVHVLDNWGWCAGECEYSSNIYVQGPGCYNSYGSAGTDQCRTDLPDPWVKYDGYVIIVPIPA
jgi:hypothetical protein